MPVGHETRPFEFDDAQNATFARLASAMAFVAVAMTALGVIVGASGVIMARSTLWGGALVLPVTIALLVMGTHLYAAARRFRFVVRTRGRDVDNLMIALDEMAGVYRIQRWLWVTVSAAVIIALLTTRGAH